MINKIKYNLLRNYYAKNLTGYMGKVKIKDDKIVCYVSKNALNKENNSIIHCIILRGTTCYSEELKNKYNLNKPIHYIIENMMFNKEFSLQAGCGTHVIIKNCTFNNIIDITWAAGEITFENNNYNNSNPFYFNNRLYFGCKAKKLNIINDVFMNAGHNNEIGQIAFGISAKVDELYISDSFIFTSDDEGKLLIDAKETQIKDSIIDCTNIELKSNVINMRNSRISAYDSIIIDNEMNNELDDIDAQEVLYNGLLIKAGNELRIDINDETLKIAKKRQELITLLNNIKNLVNRLNNEKLEKIKNSLETKEINKTLKLNKGMKQ